MAKVKISEFDTNPDNNTEIDGINIAENCPPATINNAIRELMAQLKDFQVGNQASNQLSALGGGTGLSSPGTSGNVLTSNGSGWVSSVPTYVPTGGMLMWGTASAPTGYLLCNGAAVSRSTYSALHTVIGTAFGAGDGSSTFNLPDFRDRFPVGAGTTYSAGSTGGNANSTLPAHDHTGTTDSAGSHQHSATVYRQNGLNAQYDGFGGYSDADVSGTATTQSAGSHNHTFTTSQSGSSNVGTNLPPYLGIYFIIKT